MDRFTLALLLALVLPATVQAEDLIGLAQSKTGSGTPKSGPAPRAALPPIESDFVRSNVIETLYHELAHAMIDTMDLPVFGPEEFACDYFSAVLINRMHSDEDALRMTYDIARAYEAGAVYERQMDGDAVVLWDVHGPAMQRYHNFVCNMYGANPGSRARLVDELELPGQRAETCEAEYALTEFAWAGVFDEAAEGAPGTSLFIDPDSALDTEIGQMVAEEVGRLNAAFVLPRQITVVVEPCDEANAFYDPGAYEIIMCTELEDELAHMAR